jgi:GNAT superfamily N-acetyltransferase
VASRNESFTWKPTKCHQPADFDAHTEDERILVATVDDAVLGFASIWEPDSFLHNLFVHSSAKRKGIGQALLKSCAKYFNKPPMLKCLIENSNAVKFYKVQGWTVLREEIGADGPYFLMEKACSL